jgi:hypothetical protein
VIVGTLWTGKTGSDRGEVELHYGTRVIRVNLGTIINSKEALLFEIMFNIGDLFWQGSNKSQVFD